MTWAQLIPLITQWGIPYAYEVWMIVTQHANPSQEAWDKLLALSAKSYDEYIRDAQKRAGFPYGINSAD